VTATTRTIEHVGVLGAGAWGTALAAVAARAGRRVTLWCRRRDQAVGISARRENADYLPGIALAAAIRATAEMRELASCDAVFAAAPAQHTRAVLNAFAIHAPRDLPVVLCSKGLERGSLKLMSDVLTEELPSARAAVLSGPGFANDVAQALPAATTLACADVGLGRALMTAIGQASFRPYLTDDLVGAQIGGAVKNVLAIACGIVEGRRLGKSAHAALLTRGFTEVVRLSAALGGKPETLQGLCGFGDLVLTCTTSQSRNMSLGFALGQGRLLRHVLSERRTVTEGVHTASAVMTLADRHVVDMPICRAVAEIIAERLSIDVAIEALLNRPFKVETS
jgi:glycerol-3-phosphate dehydrogenase (NAD(P)+)